MKNKNPGLEAPIESTKSEGGRNWKWKKKKKRQEKKKNPQKKPLKKHLIPKNFKMMNIFTFQLFLFDR